MSRPVLRVATCVGFIDVADASFSSASFFPLSASLLCRALITAVLTFSSLFSQHKTFHPHLSVSVRRWATDEMPSRAVVRKKQRRDAKRRKAQETAASPEGLVPASPGEVGPVLPPSTPQVRSPLPEVPTEPQVSRKRASESSSAAPSSPLSTACAAPENWTHPLKRRRAEAAPPPKPLPEGLTRRERRRWETSQRLERQMSRLNSSVTAAKGVDEEGAAQRSSTVSNFGDGDAVASSEAKLRHDPKFKHGRFWRDRKERRARTLFLGGIPSSFSVRQVKDFIHTLLDSDSGAVEYMQHMSKDAEVVEEVCMLPAKQHSKAKHMYVTMASVSLAGCAAAVLDGYKVQGRELRCNFASDKSQREEAIRRRSALQR
ncbi:hypothetical protein LSCM4_03751 [Leishmania orientalis]|uniref:RRM domain-containing protein n=1 Tax=Leishmania orientalis TaxID=2249476 RepID=A0A836KQL4_9TRYP|nr:hypothetical protein LSCM4_03751 [Leishmania orientalis]